MLGLSRLWAARPSRSLKFFYSTLTNAWILDTEMTRKVQFICGIPSHWGKSKHETDWSLLLSTERILREKGYCSLDLLTHLNNPMYFLDTLPKALKYFKNLCFIMTLWDRLDLQCCHQIILMKKQPLTEGEWYSPSPLISRWRWLGASTVIFSLHYVTPHIHVGS